MKKILVLLSFILISTFSIAQNNNFSDSNPPNIKDVSFDKDNIILNKKISYKYDRNEDLFTIKNIDGKKLIEGSIKNLGDKKFETTINFLSKNIKFSNPKIIGRNDLIFALVNFNVFNKNGTINELKLEEFIKKYNIL